MPRNTPHSEETKRKISLSKRGAWVDYKCDYCGSDNSQQLSRYKIKKRHFCNMKCYKLFVSERLPKEEQNAYKNGGMPIDEKRKRVKARNALNNAVKSGRVKRLACEYCGHKKSEAHHCDYSKPFLVKWLCTKCHWKEHKEIYEKKELLGA